MNWDTLEKELELYQKERNSYWYTEKPLFCSFTKKQIQRGLILRTESDFIGVCGFQYFHDVLSYKLFSKNDYIYIRGVESSVPPVRKTARRERNKMTLTLRFKILKRDNFRCVCCGASASDTELQIDHIIPVSKGGKTEESNLQVLCVKCNRGKSNVY